MHVFLYLCKTTSPCGRGDPQDGRSAADFVVIVPPRVVRARGKSLKIKEQAAARVLAFQRQCPAVQALDPVLPGLLNQARQGSLVTGRVDVKEHVHTGSDPRPEVIRISTRVRR